AVEHLGQFSVGRTASTGSVFGQRQHVYDISKPKAAKSYWRQQFGNTRRPFSQHAPENSDVANPHLGIRAKLELKGEAKQNHHSGAALRYLMLMASIDWHFRA
ncbi:hypothetical protein, partial [Pseudomonas aeruginosa]|uniref:hypothetical protein n=1 Tax=Pseudomonas aeruginosa TaxID=287 RepID=UPI0020C99F35